MVRKNRWILFVVLIIAVLLRFYNFTDLPFTHDEWSALNRLNYDTLGSVIKEGILPDGHPAGVQIFLYYWTHFFGFENWVVKLPFAIMGCISVFLLYKIGCIWFNQSVGLLAAAYLASLQFAVLYSQVARPYASGLFLTLLMVYYWSKLVQSDKKLSFMVCLPYVIATALCTYNHHFSLLFAFIVGISGLFIVRKQNVILFGVSGFVVCLLYIPHFPILYHQLKIGGIEGWLAKPSPDFIVDFLQYIFHFSTLLIIITVGLVGYSLIKRNKFNYIQLLFLLWFILPIGIGYAYSIHIQAVLQYSVLIFSFPFLFLAFFGNLREQRFSTNAFLVSIVLCVNIFTLVSNRKHYELFYTSIYAEMLIQYDEYRNEHPDGPAILQTHPKIHKAYAPGLLANPPFFELSANTDLCALQEYIKNAQDKNRYLFLGSMASLSPTIIPMIQEYFPDIDQQEDFVGGSLYKFSASANPRPNVISTLNRNAIEDDFWTHLDSQNFSSSLSLLQNTHYLLTDSITWGPTYTRPLHTMAEHPNDFIDIVVSIEALDTITDLYVVGQLESDQQTLHWGATAWRDLCTISTEGARDINLYYSLKLSDIDFSWSDQDILFKSFVWNKGNNSLILKKFSIHRRGGNPYLYGWIEDIVPPIPQE